MNNESFIKFRNLESTSRKQETGIILNTKTLLFVTPTAPFICLFLFGGHIWCYSVLIPGIAPGGTWWGVIICGPGH